MFQDLKCHMLIKSMKIDNIVTIDVNQIESHITNSYNNLFNKYYILHDNGLVEENIPHLVIDQANVLITLIPSSKEIKDQCYKIEYS